MKSPKKQKRYLDKITIENRTIYYSNQSRAKQLNPIWSRYYFRTQGYLYTTASLSLDIETKLSDLLSQLEYGQIVYRTPDEMLGTDASAYARRILRETNAVRYDQDISHYRHWGVVFILLTLTLYALYQFIRGSIAYSSLLSGLNMPVGISLLGWPLQILVVVMLFFFILHYIRASAYGLDWYRHYNLFYLLAIVLSVLSLFLVPYFTLYYNVFVWHVPAWIIFMTGIFYILYRILIIKYHLDDRLSDRLYHLSKKHQFEPTAPHSTSSNIKKSHNVAVNTIEDLQEGIQAATAKHSKKVTQKTQSKPKKTQPQKTQSLWNTLKLEGPLLSRSTIKEAQKMKNKKRNSKKKK